MSESIQEEILKRIINDSGYLFQTNDSGYSRAEGESEGQDESMSDRSQSETTSDEEEKEPYINELDRAPPGDRVLSQKLRNLQQRFEDFNASPYNLSQLQFIEKSSSNDSKPSDPNILEQNCQDNHCTIAPIPLESKSILDLLVSSATSTRQIGYKIRGYEGLIIEIQSSKYPQGELEAQRVNLAASVEIELNRILASILTEKDYQKLQDGRFVGLRRVHIATALPSERIIPPISKAVMILAAIIHCTMGVSRDNCTLILKSIRAILKIALRTHNPQIEELPLIDNIPITLPTVIHHLGLEEQLDTYVACPTCHTLYREGDCNTEIPDTCSMVDLDGRICGAWLYAHRHRGNRAWQQPYRRFSHLTLESWLTRLLNRPGIEDMIESTAPTLQAQCTDVWGATYMSTFPKPGEPSFFDAPQEELRLAFLVYHDFYNPFGNRQGGKKQSVGMIMMVCLNLPPDIRSNIENIYVAGMIPGPKEPALERINNYMRPIAANLEEHYTPGVVITRTHKYPRGRKVRSVAPIKSMDIVASRSETGIGGHSHTQFCSVCNATLGEIDVLFSAAFQPRSMEKHRADVQEWLSAGSLAEQEEIWKKNAARHSEWLRFPWWNVFTDTVIAPMHWTKNVLEKQIRENMGASVVLGSGIPSFPPLSRPISKNELSWGKLALEHLSASELLKIGLTQPLARHLCRENGIYEAGLPSKSLLRKLNEWRMNNMFLGNDGTAHDPNMNQVLNAKALYYLEKTISAKEKSKVSILNAHSNMSSLRYLCEHLSIGWDSSETKEHIAKRLVAEYAGTNIIWVNEQEEPGNDVAILGKEVIAEIKQEMRMTNLPGWIKKPPVNFATTEHGRIGAEEYKSLAMVSLPITLIRLWGHPGVRLELRRRLDHFLHLSLAVRILAYQSITPHDIQLFTFHYQEYLNGLKSLYPSCSITPVQHLGMHIPHFLEALGPSTRYSENIAEMFIGILQKLPTNFKMGELEQTLHRALIAASNLRALLRTHQASDVLQEFRDIVGGYLDSKFPIIDHQASGTWQTTHEGDPMQLDQTTYQALSNWAAKNFVRGYTQNLWLCTTVWRGNVKYQPYTTGLADSCVLFQPRGNNSVLTRGRIECILEEPEGALPILAKPRIVLIVRAFCSLSPDDKAWDPYVNHPLVGQQRFGIMSLYYNRVESHTAYIIEPEDIISHLAVTTYCDPTEKLSEECVVITDLDLKYVHHR
ncbi:transposase family Tnp2 protein [Rhizoctonia solani AG-3 Rhs1AP]|uniref:Transposase family Tnp2 protein n=2 Tax=Rhizoctonia solani AG-3 TaxID=1086053 RepID=A0A074RIP7_9AGAM|nr:transposase family Tnp2 protein [Rhizoctonia solani AG-3 Rhs1AP]KEP46664.1 transposase family Tnp2 protein [Rhizoctonia solani 123E]